MTPYFDYSDIDNPVKYHMDDRQYFVLNYEHFYITNMYIRRNEYTLNDDIFGLKDDKSRAFYSLVDSRTIPVAANGLDFAHVYFSLDNQIDEYERTVQTIFEAIGTIGGNYEILRISIGLFLGTYTSKMLSHQVSNKC